MIKLKSGQSIVEVVIATTLISIGVVAALSLANYSTKQNIYSKSLNQATSYNSQVADWLRSQKTKIGWAAFIEKLQADSGGGTSTYCLASIPSGASDFTTLAAGNCDPTDYISNTLFIRELTVDISDVSAGLVRASVVTSWVEKTTRTATLTMELSQWQ